MSLSPQVSSDSSAKRLRVLVVEDDADTLATTLEMLQLLGHWATGVKSAETAKDRFIAGAFDVVMTDVGLPALSGVDLAEILRSRHPVEIIFATGRARPERLPVPGSTWLRKPFSVEQLEQALDRASENTERMTRS
jgi:CheY-like chemotaxis protein